MKRLALFSLAALLLVGAAPTGARASDSNAMQEVTRSLFYGGVTGLALGGVILVANNGDNASSILRWGFVTGAFVGFGYGLYEVASTRTSRAWLELEDGKLRLRAVAPEWRPEGASVTLIAARF